MQRWWPTSALLRAVTLAVVALAVAVVTGSPVAAVLGAPFILLAAPALRHRPRTAPHVSTRHEHTSLREGQGTRAVLDVRAGGPTDGHADGRLEHLTRIAVPKAHVAHLPAGGRVGGLLGGGDLVLQVSPQRWGRRRLGHERI